MKIETMLKNISKEVDRNNGFESYDTWGNDKRTDKYNMLKHNFIDKEKNSFKVNNLVYVVEFKSSNGRTLMGGTPDSISVKSLNIIDCDNQ